MIFTETNTLKHISQPFAVKSGNYLYEVVHPGHNLLSVGLGCESIESLPCFCLCFGPHLRNNDMTVTQNETQAKFTVGKKLEV